MNAFRHTASRYRLYAEYRWRDWLTRSLRPQNDSPIAVGAVGGSGTRAIVLVLRALGVDMGTWTDPRTGDSIAVRPFLGRWFEPILRAQASGGPFPAGATRMFERVVSVHLGHTPQGQWGFKYPRSMWMLPFIAARYPKLRYIHVVRDGRDMALSDNNFMLERHGDYLKPGWRKDPVCARLELWAEANLAAIEAANRHLQQGNYLRVVYEDACADPRALVLAISRFIGVDTNEETVRKAADLVHPSLGIGRWRTSDPNCIRQPDPKVSTALHVLGYD
jgi:hypothetical protein